MSINLWANFLRNEKLDPEVLGEQDVLKLMTLCKALADKRPPCIKMHKDKIESRRLVCTTAFELGIDLLAIKKRKFHGGSKPAIGRGLLDVWNEEYRREFGSTVGTLGEAEVKRRGIVTHLADQRAEEQAAELKVLIDQNKPAEEIAARFNLPLAYVQNKIKEKHGCSGDC